jgi:hypothetical protein
MIRAAAFIAFITIIWGVAATAAEHRHRCPPGFHRNPNNVCVNNYQRRPAHPRPALEEPDK